MTSLLPDRIGYNNRKRVQSAIELAPGLFLADLTDGEKGRVLYPSIVVRNPKAGQPLFPNAVVPQPDRVHALYLVLGEVRQVSNGWRRGMWKFHMWRGQEDANGKALNNHYVEGYFHQQIDATSMMVRSAPEFFK